MKRNGYRLFVELSLLLLCSSMAKSDNVNNNLGLLTKHELMTPRDIITSSLSNITIQNKTGAAITVYGLYINQFADNTPPPHDCTAPNVLYHPIYPDSATGGAFVTPVALKNNQKVPIGKNYLYNMIYSAIYYGNYQSSLNPQPWSPMPCFLPGCSWDSPTPQPDTAGDQWCIYLGILAPAAGNSTTSNVPPYATSASDTTTGYNYNLVTQYGYIGPISCNDRTLTCSVSRAQNVAFPQ